MSTVTTNPAAGREPAVAPALLERQAPALRRYLAQLLAGDVARADAVAREVLESARNAAAAEVDDDPQVWLFRGGRKRVVGLSQRSEALPQQEPATDDDGAAEGEDPRVAVHRAIGRLTPKQQEALRLKFEFGFGLEEIATITELSRSGVAAVLHHAFQRIGLALGSLETNAGRAMNDPRLTAYALDEMAPQERRSFEDGVLDGKAVLEATRQIRDWAGLVARAVASDVPAPRRRKRRRTAWWRSWPLWVAVAAALLLAAIVAVSPRSKVGADRATAESLATNDGDAGGAARNRERDAGGVTSDVRTGTRANDGGLGFGRIAGEAAEVRPFAAGNDVGGAPGGGGSSPVFSAYGAATSGAATGLKNAGAGATGNVAPLPVASRPAQAMTDGESETKTNDRARLAEATRAEVDKSPADESPAAEARAWPILPAAIVMRVGGASPDSIGSPRQATLSREGPDRSETDVGVAGKKESPSSDLGRWRRDLGKERWPAPGSVHLAGMLNERPATDSLPESAEPVTAQLEVAPSPWKPGVSLVRVTLRAKSAPPATRGRANLVLAIDVSESMAAPNRLPLAIEAVKRLVRRLRPDDRVAIVTYAEETRVALPPTEAANAAAIRRCLAALEPVGLTNGAEGLRLAYATVRQGWIENGLNAVVLCTDGDFNLGATDEAVLAGVAADEARRGARLSVFGFGRTDRNDLRLEILARSGGGRSCYVNTRAEAERLLGQEIDGLLAPVAADLRARIEFDSARVEHAEEVGEETSESIPELLPGGSVTRLFEVVPHAGAKNSADAWLRLKVDYALPAATERRSRQFVLDGGERAWERAGEDFRFAIAAAELGRILRAGPPANGKELERLENWVEQNLPGDGGGYRTELVELIAQARTAAGVAVAGGRGAE